MSDDLVKRLNDLAAVEGEPTASALKEAADRIAKLEAALREIATGYETEWSTSTMDNMLDVAQILSERINIAHKALEGKDD
jgi:hypothetical protein